MLTEHNAPKIINYMSIDTEGSEYEILKSFPLDRWVIEVLTIEHNFTQNELLIDKWLSSKGYRRQIPQLVLGILGTRLKVDFSNQIADLSEINISTLIFQYILIETKENAEAFQNLTKREYLHLGTLGNKACLSTRKSRILQKPVDNWLYV